MFLSEDINITRDPVLRIVHQNTRYIKELYRFVRYLYQICSPLHNGAFCARADRATGDHCFLDQEGQLFLFDVLIQHSKPMSLSQIICNSR